MRKNNLWIFVLLTFALLLSASQPLRTLTVNGSGKAFLSPDIAYITIGVHTEDKDAAKAVADNSAQAQKVAEALAAFNIDPQDIQTRNFSIYPRQEFDREGQPTETIYVVDNSVYVTIRDLDQIGDILNAVVEAGANAINSVQFDVEDKSEALSAARKAAVADAKTQAQELAAAAGVELGPIQTINTFGGMPPVPFVEGLGGGARLAEAASVPVSPGQLTLTVEVNIVYEIR